MRRKWRELTAQQRYLVCLKMEALAEEASKDKGNSPIVPPDRYGMHEAWCAAIEVLGNEK